MFRFLFAILPFLMLQQVPPAGETPPDDKPKPDDKPEKVTFDDRQQRRFDDAIAAERKSTEERVRNELKAKADEDRRKADADAERTKQEAAGQFEDVKSSLTSERDTAVGERDNLKTRVETLEKLATDRLTALMADIPKEIADLGPDDETPIEKRLAWAEKAAKAAATTTTTRGAGPNPKPAGNHKIDEREEVNRIRARIPQF